MSRAETSWKLAAIVIGAFVRGRLPDLMQELGTDPQVDAATGAAQDQSERANLLWDDVLAPMFERYGARRPTLDWDPELARELIASRRELLSSDSVPRQTIAPLNNLRSTGDVAVGPSTTIRAMTDEDREELWRQFGGVGHIPHLGPNQLDFWTHVLDHRWNLSRQTPVNEEAGTQHVWDVVTALRLHHPGLVGTTFQWNRPDPPDAPLAGPWGEETLFSSLTAPVFDQAPSVEIGSDDAPALAKLTGRIAAARKDRRTALALRRFDGAYERHDREDALIDLWVAFEALLVPGDTAELSYRASLRIGRLAGDAPEERWEAFKVARESSKMRSKVVHGEAPPGDLARVLGDTRDLARKVLNAWLLDPPAGGVEDLDRAMLS